MLVQIPDEVALKYQAHADAAHQPLTKVLERQLARFATVPQGTPTLVLHGEALSQLDRLLGIGCTRSPESFLRAVEGWAGITIGDIRLDFSPGQIAEIQHRAEKQGKPPADIVADIVEQMNRNFFVDPVVAR